MSTLRASRHRSSGIRKNHLLLSKAIRQALPVALLVPLPFPVHPPTALGCSPLPCLRKDTVSNLEVAVRWAVVACGVPGTWKLLRWRFADWAWESSHESLVWFPRQQSCSSEPPHGGAAQHTGRGREGFSRPTNGSAQPQANGKSCHPNCHPILRNWVPIGGMAS